MSSSVNFPNISNLAGGYANTCQNSEETPFTKASLPESFQTSRKTVEAKLHNLKSSQFAFERGLYIGVALTYGVTAVIATIALAALSYPILIILPVVILGGGSLIFAHKAYLEYKKLRALKESVQDDSSITLNLGEIREIAKVEIEGQAKVQETINEKIQELEKQLREEQEKLAASERTVQTLMKHATQLN